MSISRQDLLRKLYLSPVETLEQVRELQAMQLKWLEKHPNDEEVLGVGESLKMMEIWLEKKDWS